MPTLIAVIKDLWNFCFGNNICTTLIDTSENLSISKAVSVPDAILVPRVEIKNETEQLPTKISSSYGEKFFIIANEAKIFQRPVWSFDGVLLTLPYSSTVAVLGFEGRFARVSFGDKYGFVLKDDLTANATDIFPQLYVGEIYSSNHPDTKKIRRIINDDFFTSELFLPLQAVEFVTFRLLKEGRKILWPDIRPRLAGSWQNTLKGQLGIQIGVMPKTGALIEYTKPDGTGFVGYTKSVHVDESIIIEGVGRLIEGEYREEAINKEEWQEWRPIWIQVQ